MADNTIGVFDWLNHKRLAIVQGTGKTPTDTNSAEANPISFNLMSGMVSLTSDGWMPQIAAIKNGGIWADSPISDGRTLIAAPVGNVIEKISIIISDSEYLMVQKQIDQLGQIVKGCRNFWQSSQIDPVYLVWWAGCGVGEQYALIYNIDISTEYKQSPTPTIQCNLTIEREPYWRGLPPGANPKLWTYYVNNQQLGINKTIANLAFLTNTDDLVYDASVKQRSEWNPTAYTAMLSRNYVDIPASLIPGDAPALVHLCVEGFGTVTNYNYDLLVGRSTRPISMIDATGATLLRTLTFNAGDAVAPTNWTKTIDATCGCLANGSAVNKYTGVNATLATGTYANFAGWRLHSLISTELWESTTLFGKYAVYFRCKQKNGALGDVQARFNFTGSAGGATVAVTGDYANLPLVAGAVTGCDNRFDLLYLGVLNIPPEGYPVGGLKGRGLNVHLKSGGGASFGLGIDVKQNNVSTRSLEFLDVVLMPIDECFAQVFTGVFSNVSLGVVIDNTGYTGHGQPETKSIFGQDQGATTDSIEDGVELRGNDLYLEPGINNRLYFMGQRVDGSAGNTFSAPDSTANDLKVHINIVPRWAGIRDA